MRTLVFALLVLIVPTLARADDLAEAKAAVAQGARLFEAHRYAEAKAQFEHADALVPNPRLAFNIGLCEEKLGHDVAAAEELDRFMSETASDPSVPEVNHRIALKTLESLGRMLVRVSIEVVPPTAQVSIDGAASRPGVHYLSRGTPHHVQAEASGFVAAQAEVPGSATQPQSLKLVLQPNPPPSVAPPPVAEEKPAPKPPEAPPQLLAPAPEPVVTRNHVPAYIALGVGAAAGIAWAYFGITAAAKAGQIPKSCETNSNGPGCSGYASYHTDATLADVFMGVSIAGGVAGGLLWAFAPTERGAGAQVQVGTRF